MRRPKVSSKDQAALAGCNIMLAPYYLDGIRTPAKKNNFLYGSGKQREPQKGKNVKRGTNSGED